MPQTIDLIVQPETAENNALIAKEICKQLNTTEIYRFAIAKKSIDARQKQIKINLKITIFFNEDEANQQPDFSLNLQNVALSPEVVVVGAGPAGLFAALRLIELGLKPVVVERGKNVRERRRDLAKINRERTIDPNSNYCFGEGGAGTYSDGKLYTRSNKRGDVERILNIFAHFGANPDIKIEAHPHIGTNKLPKIIENISQKIVECGGEIHFDTQLTDIVVAFDQIAGIRTQKNTHIPAKAIILATGHSARDIFELLDQKNIAIEAKPFALGVRIEHPQALINQIQYKTNAQNPLLPPASYQLTTQVAQRGVYSFCMCPGGIIAPCGTAQGEVVTNGWSPSRRNNPFANSGFVTEIKISDLGNLNPKFGALAALQFQKNVEQKAFEQGGKNLSAPAQRMGDFINNKTSNDLPQSSYQCGLESVDLRTVLPPFVYQSLQEGLTQLGKKTPQYLTNEAVLVATESRTSSPIRIPRDHNTLMHSQIAGLFPCAEGAGYAGGIVSAAIDGEKCAEAVAAFFKQ